MVPKQAVQIQEDYEERALWTRRGAPCTSSVLFFLALLPVGHQHGRQRGTGALWSVHEQFCSLVPGAPAGLHAKDSDDVTVRRTRCLWDE